jgi:transcriptional regulator GlxA family with amidase domain
MDAARLQRLQERVRKRNAREPVETVVQITPIETDQHYSVRQVAEMWGMSPRTIRRMFCNVVGVLKVGSAKKTLYIPERLLEEQHRKLAG